MNITCLLQLIIYVCEIWHSLCPSRIPSWTWLSAFAQRGIRHHRGFAWEKIFQQFLLVGWLFLKSSQPIFSIKQFNVSVTFLFSDYYFLWLKKSFKLLPWRLPVIMQKSRPCYSYSPVCNEWFKTTRKSKLKNSSSVLQYF